MVVGEGNTYEEALEDVKSAIKFHLETFGNEAFEDEEIIETFVAEVNFDEIPKDGTSKKNWRIKNLQIYLFLLISLF